MYTQGFKNKLCTYVHKKIKNNDVVGGKKAVMNKIKNNEYHEKNISKIYFNRVFGISTG